MKFKIVCTTPKGGYRWESMWYGSEEKALEYALSIKEEFRKDDDVYTLDTKG